VLCIRLLAFYPNYKQESNFMSQSYLFYNIPIFFFSVVGGNAGRHGMDGRWDIIDTLDRRMGALRLAFTWRRCLFAYLDGDLNIFNNNLLGGLACMQASERAGGQ
jgi:hypothetical protein